MTRAESRRAGVPSSLAFALVVLGSTLILPVFSVQAVSRLDCAALGGKYQCSEPKVGPVVYRLCDDQGPYVFRMRLWCDVRDGEWWVSESGGSWGCLYPEPVTEDSIVPWSTEFEQRVHNACEISHADTGWMSRGETVDSYNCWSGGQTHFFGIETSNLRKLDFSGRRPNSQGECASEWQEAVMARRDRDVRCPPGYEYGSNVCYKPLDDTCPVGNPTRPASGGKRLREVDFEATGVRGLRFVRHFNSQGFFRPIWQDDHSAVSQRDFWRHTYDRRLVFHPDSENLLAVALRPDGQPKYFHDEGLEAHVTSGAGSRLKRVDNDPPITWHLITADETVEAYDANGRLHSIRFPDGELLTLTHDDGRLSSVRDRSGRQLTFHYDGLGQLIRVAIPSGKVLAYSYDGRHRPIAVTYPGGAERRYLYEDKRFPYLVTGIIDANGDRFSTYAYDSQGRVKSAERAGGADRHEFYYYSWSPRTNITGPLGNVRSLRYANVGGVSRQTRTNRYCEACGTESKRLSYYPSGLVKSREDFNGNVTAYDYNDRGLEVRRAEAADTPSERVIETDWHPEFRKPVEIRYPGRTVRFAYNERGQRVRRTELDAGTGDTRTWRYDYCDQVDTADPNAYCPHVGLRKSVDGPRSDVADVTHYFYYTDTAPDGSHRPGDLWRTVNAAGHVTEFLAYDANGRVLRRKGPNGVVTSFTYHPRGWITSRTVHGAGGTLDAVTRFEYDPSGNITRLVRADGSAISYAYDAAHRLVVIEDALGNRVEYTLDAAGNRTGERYMTPDGSLFRKLAREYDELSRLVSEINGTGDTTTHAYDPGGNRVSTKEPDGDTTGFQYDALNRLEQSLDALGGTTSYAYDDEDRLVQVVDPRGVTTEYDYNGFGDLLAERSPDAGTTQYAYDTAGNRVQRTDARGVDAVFEYDDLNRLTAVRYPDNGEATQFSYDQGTLGIGRLTGIDDPTGSIRYSYDSLGNTVSDQRIVNGTRLDVGYAYNAAGDMVALTYPSGARVDLERDAAGRISTVSVTKGGVTEPIASDIGYAPFGPVRQLTWGDGSVLTRKFDTAGRLVEQQTDGFQHLNWSYAPDGNITAQENLIESEKNQTFSYDALNRLTGAEGSYGALQYAYDGVGNRTRLTEDGTVTEYTYAADSNRLLHAGSDQYAYDAAGNTTQAGDLSLSYDVRGRLARVVPPKGKPASYAYNALGQRVTKTINRKTTLFAYDLNGHLIGEYDESGKPLREYIYLNNRPIAMLRPKGQRIEVLFIHTDHLGTPKLLTNDKGQVRWEAQTRPFGKTEAKGKGVELPLRFPGQYEDGETGVHYNYYRDYDPMVGRFIESDPIGLGGGVNTYGYVFQNPLKYIDQAGLASWYCTRGLNQSPGTRGFGRFHHAYLCVSKPNGSIECGGQTSTGWPWDEGRPTRPDEDYYDSDSCENQFDDNEDYCVEQCLLQSFQEPRPRYGLFGPGTECQEWATDNAWECLQECGDVPAD